ncbi:MAG: hypothetical protein QM731_10510 [Chitinophagaceae bacterium]
MTNLVNTAPGSSTPSRPQYGRPAFRKFVFGEKQNRQLFWVAIIAMIVEFIIFKLCYPYPDFFSDSYSYLFAADNKLDINIWPIGYSKFIASFHAISFHDTALIGFQYFLFGISALYFYFSILYFFEVTDNSKLALYVFLFFNPLFLYVCNYVNSDPLFIALSMIWMTQLIWIIYSPMMYQVFTHGIILFLCFTVRNNAYYYPVITAITLLLSQHRRYIKLIGIAFPVLLIFIFVQRTREAAYELTGSKTFSLFTGWQLANNALYIYDHIQVNPAELPSASARELDTLAKNFYKKVPADFNDQLSTYVGNFFIRQPEAPLKQYLVKHYRDTTKLGSVINWGQGSADFDEYGSWILKKNPVTYARYFMLMNSKNYFLPPLEKLEVYNLGRKVVAPIAAKWFHYPGTNIESVSPTAQGYILMGFPFFTLVINAALLLFLLWFLITRRYRKMSKEFNRTLLILTLFQAANFAFSVAATIIVFRYQVFPLIACVGCIAFMTKLLEPKANKAPAGTAETSNDEVLVSNNAALNP